MDDAEVRPSEAQSGEASDVFSRWTDEVGTPPLRLLYDRIVTSRIASVNIGAVNPFAVAEFWKAALGWEVVFQDDTGVDLAAPGTSMPTLEIGKVSETKTVKNRLHFDLRADGSSTEAELDRLLSLGATRIDVGQGPDVSWVVLADPGGNEFCLLQRSVQEAEVARGDG
jgi:Glyoxalase-like domain